MNDRASQQFTATVNDQFSNALSSQPSVTWSVQSGGIGGSVSSTGLYSAPYTGAGSDTVQATSGSLSGTAPVTVVLMPPPTAVNLTATGGDGEITLSWGTPLYQVSGFNVYRGTSPGGESSTPITLSAGNLDTNVVNGTTYYYEVAAYNAAGEGPRSNEASATPEDIPTVATPAAATPSPATGTTTSVSVLGADGSNTSLLTYTWSSTGQASVTFSPNGTNAAQNSTATFTAAGSYRLIATITNPQGYSVSNWVAVTVNQTITTLSATPATASIDTGATQQFSASGLDQFGAAVSPLTGDVWSVLSGAGTIDQTGLFTAPSTAEVDTVQSAVGSATASASVTVKPMPPTDLVALSADQTVSLMWNPSPSTVDGYNIYRGLTSGGEASPALNSPFPFVDLMYEDSGLTDGQAYYYFVTAISNGIESDPSNESWAIPNSNPPLITSGPSAIPSITTGTTTALSVTATDSLGASSMTYTWSVIGASPGGVAFSPNGTNAASATTATFTAAGTYDIGIMVRDTQGGGASSDVLVQVVSTPTSIAISPSAVTVNPNSTLPFTATELDQFGIVYSPQPPFDWSAASGTITSTGIYTAPASGPGSDTVTASDDNAGVTGTSAITVNPNSYANGSQSGPTNLHAAVAGNKVTLTWSGVSGAAGYWLYRSTSSNEANPVVMSVASTSYVDSALPNATYYYEVEAYFISNNAISFTSFSGQVSAAVTAGLAAPAGLTIVAMRDSQVTLSWNAVSGATGYNVQCSGNASSGSGGNDVKITKCTIYNVGDGPLPPRMTNDTFTVTALSSAGESAPSNAVNCLPTTDSVGSIYVVSLGSTTKVYVNDGTPSSPLINGEWTISAPGVFEHYTPPSGTTSTGIVDGWGVTYNVGYKYFMITAPANAAAGTYHLTYGVTPSAGIENEKPAPSAVFSIVTGRAAGPGPAYPWQGSVGGVNTYNGNKMTSLAIVGWTARGGMPVQFGITHNSEAVRSGLNGELGSKWSSSYDVFITETDQYDLQVTWGNGRTYTLSKSAVNRIWLGPPGVNDRLTVNPSGNGIGSIDLRTEDDYKYHFVPLSGSTFVPSTITDLNGNVVTVNHAGPNGSVSSVVDPTDRTLTFHYDPTSNLLTSVTDPLNRTWTLSYDGNSNLTKVTWPVVDDESTLYNIQYGYNANSDITSVTDRRGNTSTYSYNSDDSIAWEAPPAGYKTYYGYSGMQTVITDPNGHTLTHNYANGCLSSTKDAAGERESYTYDGTDSLLTTIDRNGHRWTYDRDYLGNDTIFNDPYLNTTVTLNTAYSKVYLKADANGDATAYNYDENDNLLTSTDALGNVTSYTYDSYGQELSCADPLGQTTSYTYDSNGYRNSTTDADGNTARSYCDVMGRELSSTDGLNQTTTYTVDNWNRRTSVTDPDNSTTTTTTYDVNDNVLTVTDPSSHTQYNTYDAENRLLTHINGRGDEIANDYDDQAGQLGLLSRSEDGNGHITTYAYTPRNDIATTYYPDGTQESISYNAGQQQYQHTDGNGKTITYEYTANDRLCEILYPTGVNTYFYYDAANRRTAMTDSTGTTTWAYDGDNRVTQLASPKSTESYYYDAAGQRTQMTLAGKGSWYYGYYNSGLSHTVKNPANYITTFVYDAADRLTTQTDGNGSVVTYSYNDLDQVLSEVTQTSEGGALASDSYTYWPNGTVETKADSDGSTTTYGYDGDDQLTSEVRTGTNAYTIGYTYDDNSNRLTKTLNGVTDTYSYDAGDKLLSTSTKSFTYDNNGNVKTVTSGGSTTTYNWDYEDRLTSIAGTTAVNTYNGLDQRINRVGLSSTNFPYVNDGADPGDPVLCDGQDVYTPGLSQTAISTNGTSFYVLDRLGSSTRMLGPGQGVTDSQVFDAFGNSQAADRIGTTWPVAFGFGAKSNYQTDQDTGLQLLGHRFYDPTIGRFLSRDPVHDGTNDYVYVENNPVDAVDPTGEVMFGTVDMDARAASMAGGGGISEDIIMDTGKQVDQIKPGSTGKSTGGGGTGSDDALLKPGLYPAASDALRSIGVDASGIGQTIGNAAASSGTHKIDGVVNGKPFSAATDLRVNGLNARQIKTLLDKLGKVGFAAWYRNPGHDGWPAKDAKHIHAVYAGASPMKGILRNQVRDYIQGKTGLVGHEQYTFWSPPQADRDAVRNLFNSTHEESL